MKISFTIFLMLCSGALLGQQKLIKGVVRDQLLNSIPSATIQLKSTHQSSLGQYAFTDSNGFYNLKISSEINAPFLVIASCLGYKRDTIIVEPGQFSSDIVEIDFNLNTDSKMLDEIHISAKLGIQVDNDTTSYSVVNFASPEDRNLEDVLKKMPGMEVKDGAIFFKGKKIVKVLLDGDDLTGEGYKVLTRNLRPEFVKDVQAIEHYVDDDLLKGIINSDDIVLNLKMKNPKALFGSIDAGAGISDRFRVAGNVISYVKKTKAYVSAGANNIGQTNSNLLSLSDSESHLPSSRKVINHGVLTNNPFDFERFQNNKSSLFSGNAVKVVNDDLNFKVNLNLINDRLSNETFVENKFFEAAQTTILDRSDNDSKNITGNINTTADYLITPNSRLWANFAYTYKPDRFDSQTFSTFNEDPTSQISQNQNDLTKNFQTELKYTLKANEQFALIFGGQMVSESLSQDYRPNSLLYSSALFKNATALQQVVNQKNNQVKLNTDLLFRKQNHYFNLGLGYNSQQTGLESELLYQSQEDWISYGELFQNSSEVKDQRLFLNAVYTFDNGLLKIQSRMISTRLNTMVFNQVNTKTIFQPYLSATLNATTRQTISLSYQYRNITTNPFEYYRKNILTDIRSTRRGLTEFYNFGTHQASFSYNYNDFADKYLSATFSSDARASRQGFIYNSLFEEGFYISQKIPYQGLKSISGTVQIQKFSPLLSSNLSALYSLSARNYFSIIAGQTKEYIGNTHHLTIKGDTGFDFPVNFNAQFELLSDATLSQRSLISSNNSVKYSFMARGIISPTLLSIASIKWYRINGQHYPLLNSEIQWNPKRGAFKFNLEGQNLSNMRSLDTFYIGDVFSSRLSSSILPRSILLNVHFSIK